MNSPDQRRGVWQRCGVWLFGVATASGDREEATDGRECDGPIFVVVAAGCLLVWTHETNALQIFEVHFCGVFCNSLVVKCILLA